MGLFDFAVNMGKKLFGKDDDPVDKIKKQIEANREVIKDPNLIYPGQKIRIPLD